MKKVLIVNHTGYLGGGGVSLLHIVESFGLMPEKYKLEVYCPFLPPDMCNLLEEKNIKVFKAKTNPTIISHYSGNDKPIINRHNLINIINLIRKNGWHELEEVIKNSNPDIVAFNSMTLCWMGKLVKKLGIKTVCFHRETYAKGTFGIRTRYIKKCIRNHFNAVAFISNNDIEETGPIAGHAQLITDKVKVSIDNELTKKLKLFEILDDTDSVDKKLIYLGGANRLKGAHIILKALIELKDQNVKLIFLKFDGCKEVRKIKDYNSLKHKLRYILNMDYEAKLMKLIDKNDLWEKIIFIPTVVNPEDYIRSSDILVFPATSAHQSRPLYEAGVARVPIILTDFKQTREFAKDNFNCLTFKNHDYKDLSKKILQLMENEEVSYKIIENNYNQTIKYHNFKDMANEIDLLCTKIY
ncbi:glycosyltransferase [Planococcus sp. SE5232]|uniref:glycosyltransferase n=1 Tax=unclassified Planococcus (in: firmicutes) TaxID=2662419 RepID=UPI003D6B2595